MLIFQIIQIIFLNVWMVQYAERVHLCDSLALCAFGASPARRGLRWSDLPPLSPHRRSNVAFLLLIIVRRQSLVFRFRNIYRRVHLSYSLLELARSGPCWTSLLDCTFGSRELDLLEIGIAVNSIACRPPFSRHGDYICCRCILARSSWAPRRVIQRVASACPIGLVLSILVRRH